jgi:hypothetical protein
MRTGALPASLDGGIALANPQSPDAARLVQTTVVAHDSLEPRHDRQEPDLRLKMDAYLYGVLAETVDLAHALAMLVWGLGLPLLAWHRFPRWSRAYMWFAIAFVLISAISHYVLGECVLTTVARWLWHASGRARDGAPFMTLLVNSIAGIRPSNRAVVHAWELAVLATSVGSLWCWARTSRKSYAAS